MARYDFGDTVPDWTFTTTTVSGTAGVLQLPSSGATLTFWTAKTGGTQYTDLRLGSAPSTPTSTITVGSDGVVPAFQGPDGITSMWVSGGGARTRINTWTNAGAAGGGGGSASDATTTTNGVVRLAGDLGGTAGSPTVPGLAGKAATTHTHTASQVSDSGSTGRAVLAAATPPDGLTALGAASTTGLSAAAATANAAVPKTVVDAKGDLIVATGNDLVARLAAGTNGQYVGYDSTTATGLKGITPPTWSTLSADAFPLATTDLVDGHTLYYDEQSGAWVNRASPVTTLPPYLLQGAVFNPGQSVPADWPNGAIAFVRSSAPTVGVSPLGTAGTSSTSTSQAVTLTDAVAVGENIFVAVSAPSAGTVLSNITVTDASSNTYTLRSQRLQGATIQGQAFSARATTALAAGAAITVTFAASAGDIEVVVSKMTGLASPAFDQSGVNSGNGVTQVAVSTGGATALANEIAMLSVHWNNGAIVAPSSWAQAGWVQVGPTRTSGTSTPKNCAVFWKQFTTVQTVSVTPQVDTAGIMVATLNTYKAV